MAWTIRLALATAFALVALIGLRWLAEFGRARWTAATRLLIGQLEAARLPKRTPRYDARELAGLPARV